MANNECHLFRRAQRSRDEQIAFVFAIVIVGDDDDPASRKGGKHRLYTMIVIEHACSSQTARAAARPLAPADADSGPRSRRPPSPLRSAPRESRHRDRGGLW